MQQSVADSPLDCGVVQQFDGGFTTGHAAVTQFQVRVSDSHGYFGFGGTAGSHELYIGPAVRYYMPREDDLQIYYIANPFFALATGTDRLGMMAGAGVNYFLTERVALEARFSYRFLRYVDEFFGYNSHRIGFNAGISVFFPSLSFLDDIRGKRSTPKEEEEWSPN